MALVAEARSVQRAFGVGDVIAGKYRLSSLVGSGAMGLVYEATHVELRERVAVKLMLPQLTGVDELVMRFLQEARTAARIKSPHVPRVFDVGCLEEGVAPYLAMELLEGLSLAECIDEGRFDFREAASIVAQAARGVEEAHALGIVHRDLKPGNLFLARERDGTVMVKVLDFGIAKAANSADLRGTQTGALMGSPRYMSPEQLRSARDVDPRADVWSLGVILYELVTGSTPYESAAFGELVLDVHANPPRPVETLRPDVPEALRAIIARCLVREREERLPSARELADALSAFAGVVRLDATVLLEPQIESGDEPSDTMVVDALRTAAAAWPTVVVPPSAFRVALLGAIARGADPALVCLGDLYLAVGCLEGDPAALEELDRLLGQGVVPALRRSRAAGSTGVIAVALRRWLLGTDGGASGLAEYTGRSPLVAWLRVAALRRARDSQPPMERCEVIPEDALDALTAEDRLAFRLHARDHVPIERIAQMLGVPADVIARRLEDARIRMLDAVRARAERTEIRWR